MKDMPRKLGYCFAIGLFMNLLSGGQVIAASNPQSQPSAPKAELNLGEDPGPIYTQEVRNWAQVTNFAKNAADVAVGKLKLDMQKDPKLQKIMSRELMADLEQFFYELFISPETMTDLAKVYSQYFTLDEMQELINFYKSPLGQKLVKSNADLTLKTQQIGMDLLRKHEKGYMQVISKYMNQADKK